MSCIAGPSSASPSSIQYSNSPFPSQEPCREHAKNVLLALCELASNREVNKFPEHAEEYLQMLPQEMQVSENVPNAIEKMFTILRESEENEIYHSEQFFMHMLTYYLSIPEDDLEKITDVFQKHHCNRFTISTNNVISDHRFVEAFIDFKNTLQNPNSESIDRNRAWWVASTISISFAIALQKIAVARRLPNDCLEGGYRAIFSTLLRENTPTNMERAKQLAVTDSETLKDDLPLMSFFESLVREKHHNEAAAFITEYPQIANEQDISILHTEILDALDKKQLTYAKELLSLYHAALNPPRLRSLINLFVVYKQKDEDVTMKELIALYAKALGGAEICKLINSCIFNSRSSLALELATDYRELLNAEELLSICQSAIFKSSVSNEEKKEFALLYQQQFGSLEALEDLFSHASIQKPPFAWELCNLLPPERTLYFRVEALAGAKHYQEAARCIRDFQAELGDQFHGKVNLALSTLKYTCDRNGLSEEQIREFIPLDLCFPCPISDHREGFKSFLESIIKALSDIIPHSDLPSTLSADAFVQSIEGLTPEQSESIREIFSLLEFLQRENLSEGDLQQQIETSYEKISPYTQNLTKIHKSIDAKRAKEIFDEYAKPHEDFFTHVLKPALRRIWLTRHSSPPQSSEGSSS